MEEENKLMRNMLEKWRKAGARERYEWENIKERKSKENGKV